MVQHLLPFDDLLLENLLEKLHQEKIATLKVEGGAKLLNSFIEKNLWQEARVLIGNQFLLEGIAAPKLKVAPERIFQIGEDILEVYQNEV